MTKFNTLLSHRLKFGAMGFMLLSYGIILLIIIFNYMPCSENDQAIPRNLYITLIIFIGIGFGSFIWLAAIRWKKMSKYVEKINKNNLLKEAENLIDDARKGINLDSLKDKSDYLASQLLMSPPAPLPSSQPPQTPVFTPQPPVQQMSSTSTSDESPFKRKKRASMPLRRIETIYDQSLNDNDYDEV